MSTANKGIESNRLQLKCINKIILKQYMLEKSGPLTSKLISLTFMIHRSISLSLSQYEVEGGGLQPLSLSKKFLIQCIAGHRKCMPHWNNKLQSWNIVHQHDAFGNNG